MNWVLRWKLVAAHPASRLYRMRDAAAAHKSLLQYAASLKAGDCCHTGERKNEQCRNLHQCLRGTARLNKIYVQPSPQSYLCKHKISGVNSGTDGQPVPYFLCEFRADLRRNRIYSQCRQLCHLCFNFTLQPGPFAFLFLSTGPRLPVVISLAHCMLRPALHLANSWYIHMLTVYILYVIFSFSRVACVLW